MHPNPAPGWSGGSSPTPLWLIRMQEALGMTIPRHPCSPLPQYFGDHSCIGMDFPFEQEDMGEDWIGWNQSEFGVWKLLDGINHHNC